MVEIIVEEQYGNRGDTVCKYSVSESRVQSVGVRHKSYSSVKNWMCNVFLPTGYPSSVTPDYVQYQIWDTLQAFASSLTGALATEAILKGIGVGDSSATSLAASLTWLQKEGTGMIGRIAFAWWKGSALDCDSKRWRLFADVLNDAAICMEIMAPHFKPIFPIIVCLSSVCKSIVGLVGGATRAALTQHQARRNNLADVAAKDGSQETLVNLMALCCNMLLLRLVSGHFVLTWTVYVIFTLIHLLANYMAVRSLQMDSINYERLNILVDNYLKCGKKTVLSVPQANRIEPIVTGFVGHLVRKGPSVRLGASVCSAVSANVFESFQRQLHSQRMYIILHDGTTVHVLVKKDADTRDMLMACFAVLCMLNSSTGPKWLDMAAWLDGIEADFRHFEAALLEGGWKTGVCLLNFDEWRVTPSN